jgi:hypothetical protein
MEELRTAVEAVDREVLLLVELERAAVVDGMAMDGLCQAWTGLQELLAAPSPRRGDPGRDS